MNEAKPNFNGNDATPDYMDNIEDFENQCWCQMDKEKYDLDELIRDLTKVGSISKSEARRRILEYKDQEVKKNDEKWWTACMYNVDIESWDRIRGAKHALEAPGKNEIPMGISQWKKIGEKFGYYEYFRKEEVKNSDEKWIKFIMDKLYNEDNCNEINEFFNR